MDLKELVLRLCVFLAGMIILAGIPSLVKKSELIKVWPFWGYLVYTLLGCLGLFVLVFGGVMTVRLFSPAFLWFL